jgi:NAD(P)-dependent dehydrogenase (short-subunit alcohol dehydrogenase family)
MAIDPGRVLITGGTRGLGRAIALEATRHGARVCVTHRWGSVEPGELEALFTLEGLDPPRVEECDASDPAQNRALIESLYADWGGLDSVVSGVAFAAPVAELADLRRGSLEIALGYTAWPLLDLAQAAVASGAPPKRFLAISSLGVDRALPGYDMVGVSKAALEALVRYLAARLKPKGVAVNALRLGYVDTESFRAALPSQAELVAVRNGFMDPAAGARAAVALLSGLMDSMTGQIVTVDEGVSLLPPFSPT